MIALLIGVASYISAGVLSLLLPDQRSLFGVLGWVGALIGTSLATFSYLDSGSLVSTLGRWGPLGIELKIDQTTILFILLVVILNLFTLWYLRGRKKATFYCLYNFLFATSFSVGFSNDLFNLYVTIELMSLLSILLIGYERKAYQIYAGIKYLLLSSLAMSLYLIGLGIIYRSGGYLGIEKLARSLAEDPDFAISLGLGLMVTGLAVKGGVLLFSMWLPDAYSYSGTVVSVVLSGIATKFGLIGIIRLSAVGNLNYLLLVLGALTGLGGAVFAIAGKLPKRILAYSTISQVGYILIGVGTGTVLGITGASLHIFFHGLFKSLLFLSVGHAGVGAVSIYGGLKASIPLASKIGLTIGSLSVMAVPPFSGYFSKNALVNPGVPQWIWYVVLVIGLATVVYLVKLNWALLVRPTAGGFNSGDLTLVVFGIVVALSGLVTVAVLGGAEFIKLFNLINVITAFGLALGGGSILFGLGSRVEVLEVPGFPFNLENSLISLFTGFIVIAAVLLIV
ncbi:MAG: complex I subunit 5 family protein [Candidatus Bipolaricaulota bacterium]